MRPPESVLVVSPDATTLQGLTRALMQSGWSVLSALGWQEAESRLRRFPISLVVTDLEGPGPDDLDWVRRLRSEFPHVGIIALVSLRTPEVRAVETEGIVLAVLEKPIGLARLEESVQRALARTASP
jgi:DNA-binding response OmpR family regulator